MPTYSTSIQNHPIKIPSDFPAILKAYTKAAIRTQPRDLLLWSAAYFRCLASGESPPAKDRLEYPVPNTDSGLSPGLLRVLHRQLGTSAKVSTELLSEKWRNVCLSQADLQQILLDGGWKKGEVDWLKFVGLGCRGMGTNMEETMRIVCEVLSDTAGTYTVSCEQFKLIYKYLTERNPDGSAEKLAEVLDYVDRVGAVQDGSINPQNFKTPDSPALD